MRLLPPLPIPLHVTSAFGDRVHPVTGERSFHNGVDLRAPEGTQLLAPGDGVVTRVWTGETGGQQLTLRLDSGYSVGFAHLSQQWVNEGERVSAGQVLGETGATGRVTGPHLHLTIHDPAGSLVDPMKLLAGGAAAIVGALGALFAGWLVWKLAAGRWRRGR